MAYFDSTWYVSSVKYAAVTARPQNTAVAAGQIVRQFTAPSVNSERCFVCTIAGTTANTTDAAWAGIPSRGSKLVDGTVTWQECTGASAVNGDAVNTSTWAQAKVINSINLGVIIKRNNGASYHIASAGGGLGASEPAFSDTAGASIVDGGTTWICIGPVGNFPAWGAPHARLANAYATNWGAAGHKFYLADNHAETQSTSLTMTSPATASGGATYALCVDRTASVPPVEVNYNIGATISTTGASAITFAGGNLGSVYYQGITFSAGDAASSANINLTLAYVLLFKNCIFKLSTTSASPKVNVGSASGTSAIFWDNCAVQFGSVSQSVSLQCMSFEWKNTSSPILGATLPTSLFSVASGSSNSTVCRGIDFSGYSGQLLASNQQVAAPLVLEDCKFHASMTRYGASASGGYGTLPLITVRCDSGATNYKSTRDEYSGSQITETSITRVGGATDGTTPQSIKIATNSQATFLTPYRMLRLAAWNDVTGSNRTVTVCGTINSGSLPLNDEIWMDVQYLGSSSSPQASFKTTCKSHPLAAGAAVASDGSTWNNASPLPVFFDPTTVTNTTLSNGNLTATHSNTTSNSGARVSAPLFTGKYYFEITVVAGHGNFDAMGLMSPTGSYVDLLGSVTSVFVTRTGGTISANNIVTGISLGAFAANDVLGVAVDFDAHLIWCRKNAGNWNFSGTANPATGVGGIAIAAGSYVPAVGFIGTGTAVNDAYTANFGTTAYANAAPSDFGSLVLWSHFKLVATLGQAAGATTWNPADKASHMTLSNGNLTLTGDGTFQDGGCRSTTSLSSGKAYFEIVLGASYTRSLVGIATSVATLASFYTSSATGGVAVDPGNGFIYINGSVDVQIETASPTLPFTVCVAVDLTASLFWVRMVGSGLTGFWNGSGTANPATGVGGKSISALFPTNPAFVAIAVNSQFSAVRTANFGATSFSQTVPSGFTGWSSLVPATLQPQMKGYIYASIRAAKPSTTLYIDPQITLG